MKTIEERIAKLEESTARWRFATIGMVGVLAVGLLAGQSGSQNALTDLESSRADSLQGGLVPKVAAVVPGAGNTLVRVYTNGYTEAMNGASVFTNNCSGGWNSDLQVWEAGCPDGNWNPIAPYEP